MLKINSQGEKELIKREEPLTPEEFMGHLWLVCFDCKMDVMTSTHISKITEKPPKGLETETSFQVTVSRKCPRCQGTRLGRPIEKLEVFPDEWLPDAINRVGVLASRPETTMRDGRVLMD
jgi:hypothetical protein